MLNQTQPQPFTLVGCIATICFVTVVPLAVLAFFFSDACPWAFSIIVVEFLVMMAIATMNIVGKVFANAMGESPAQQTRAELDARMLEILRERDRLDPPA
jgi:hypothetical protein